MSRRKGFTLIEVIVAVMIISVVIAALLQLQSNNTHIFEKLKKDQEAQRYISLIAESAYGYEDDEITLDRLVDRFDVDDTLRRELKNIKVKLIYQETDRIDLSALEDENMTDGSTLNLEIGRTVIKLPQASASVVRIRLQ